METCSNQQCGQSENSERRHVPTNNVVNQRTLGSCSVHEKCVFTQTLKQNRDVSHSLERDNAMNVSNTTETFGVKGPPVSNGWA
nr:hypothetical protein BgiMline_027781 [Biomphalaria glabrata]